MRRRAVSTLIDSQTPLSWTWTWTCGIGRVKTQPARLRSPAKPLHREADAAPVPPLSPVIPTEPAPATLALVPVFTVDVPLTPKFPPLLGASLVPSLDSCRHTKSSWDRSTWMSPSSWTSGLRALPELLLPVPGVPGVRRRFGAHRAHRDARCARTGRRPRLLEARAGAGTPRSGVEHASADDDADRSCSVQKPLRADRARPRRGSRPARIPRLLAKSTGRSCRSVNRARTGPPARARPEGECPACRSPP